MQFSGISLLRMGKPTVLLATVLFAVSVSGFQEPAESGAGAGIKLTVKEGEGALNNIRTLRAKEPVVVVTDPSDNPIAGAQVTFLTPEVGATATFPSGNSTTITTVADGLATGRGLRPNNVVGEYEIRVVASFQGQTARAAIRQTNAAPKVASNGNTKKALLIAALGGAGAAVAIGVSRGGGKNSSTPAQSGTSISAGGSSFGPPR